MELLEVMLEETDPSSPILARQIFAQLTLSDLLLTMKQLWESLSPSDGKTNKGKWRNGLLKSYHTLKMIAHYRGFRPEETSKWYIGICLYTGFSTDCTLTVCLQSGVTSSSNLERITLMWRRCWTSVKSGHTALRSSTSLKEFSLESIFPSHQR